ncbi:DinB family protein [Aureliella helgolandensis]|uniref:DinB-like domain-containing protein n=1 Tax=Aureliella helgolandensis TaxID=2527968 RepID=A0A518GEF4_9BACT|nr:DinB family protein [Aureliella helgolandensis]QDV26979.1 hypothetical protein Q31a_53590 [Aureliella helgolandensis]
MLPRCHCGLLLFAMLTTALASAADGDPIGIRIEPEGVATIETLNGLRLRVVGETPTPQDSTPSDDQTLLLSEQSYRHALSRPANVARPTWQPLDAAVDSKAASVQVQSVAAGTDVGLLIQTDGVQLLVGAPLAFTQLDVASLPELRVDACVLLANEHSQELPPKLAKVFQQLSPRFVLISNSPGDAAEWASSLQSHISPESQVATREHNAFAIAAVAEHPSASTQVVVLGEEPWKMPAELEELFEAMEQAARESQAVFAKLSAKQMNFKPANGTHTPRWNTEHMMGRQLLFFSQIYHAVDPTIPVLDLNPQQMPPDYTAAHPEWDGAEEARQIERVGAFCRRFAYLLDGIAVDSQAPGSRWPTLRALLVQMEAHYAEHTGNTVKKFDLPDWPAE